MAKTISVGTYGHTPLHDRIKNLKILTIIFAIGLLAFDSYLTIKQNTYRQDPIRFYKRTLKYAPDSSMVHYNLGLIYKTINKNEEAIASYDRAVKIKPDYVEAYSNLGIAYAAMNRREEAVTAYKQAIEINPNYATAYNNLSVIYSERKQYQSAIECCDKARNLGFVNTALLKALEPYR
ncbi:MAG: tetratricopeptide repeat protein [Candidatus Omnitrophica bacterium]|nr:tetratricopeptide repeat protein [Candidatus Omnitrophota bacterium]